MSIPKQLVFEQSEYEKRIEQVQRSMSGARLDALLLFSPQNIYYLSGMDSENQFDYQCLVVPAKGDAMLVLLDFEHARYDNSAWIRHAEVYGTFDDPIKATLSVVSKLGCASGTLGIERRSRALPIESYLLLANGVPSAKIVDAFGIVEGCRITKSAAEIAYMQRAARLTEIGVEAGYGAIRAGACDCEVAAAVIGAMYQNGGSTVCWGPIVAGGYRAGSAHSTFNGYRFKTGDTVFIETTGEVHRYVSPLMRTAIIGKPKDHIKRVEAAVSAALTVILQRAKEGVRASEVAKAALSKLQPILEGMIFHYNFGYPVGIGYPPSWIEELGFFLKVDNERTLKSGMTFHLPMSIRKYGESAVNLSQTILIREDGAVPLGGTPAILHIVE